MKFIPMMVGKHTIFKLISLIFILSILSVGCGYNPKEAVYDIAENPHEFPNKALAIVEIVEGTENISVDRMIDSFVELYSEHTDLLDNQNWQEVVSRIGLKLRYRANKLVGSGVEEYLNAAAMYRLSSFARPEDRKIQTVNKLFSCWDRTSSIVILKAYQELQADSTIVSFEYLIAMLKQFSSWDRVHAEFANEYLVHQLVAPTLREHKIKGEVEDSLSSLDLGFLASYQLMDMPDDTIYCHWENPAISLPVFGVTRLDAKGYMAELYLVPDQKIKGELMVALWVEVADSLNLHSSGNARYIPFDFEPVLSSTEWKAGHPVALMKEFEYSGEVTHISIGLYRQDEQMVSYVPIAGISGNLIRLSLD